MFKSKYFDKIECGVDEAGRGSLFGPLYCGACIFYNDDATTNALNIIKDSKKYKSSAEREKAYDFIINNALSYGSAYAEPHQIDEKGLTNAWLDTMHRAIINTNICADVILVDGNYFKQLPYMENYTNYTFETIVNGDNLYYSIAAGSIIAKVEHDRHIKSLIEEYPILNEYYDLENNKGYGSKTHIEGIEKYGITKFHRKSYKTCINKSILNL